MSARVVPKKNYYILFIMIFVVVIITFSVASIIKGIKSEKINTGYINKYVSELQYSELDNYLIEPASNTFIYLSYTGDEEVYNLETKLRKVINNYELQTNFIYVNVTDEMVNANFYDEINQKIDLDEKIKRLPVILYYKDGNLIDVVQGDGTIFNVADFQKMLDNYEIAS